MHISYFTRLLEDVSAAERYRFATDQIQHAERLGYHRAWVAQHHFHPVEGGLPSPFVFLADVARQTERIRLGTGIITLTLEDPVRVAEDAVVADILSGGRIDIGLGSGGTPRSFAPFGLKLADKTVDFERKLTTFTDALAGSDLGDGNTLYPPAGSMPERVWQATFSAAGGRRAGAGAHGLMLSRTQPRPSDKPNASLYDLQMPIIEAYLDALPDSAEPRIMASRTVYTADDRAEALGHAETGLRRVARLLGRDASAPVDELIANGDTYLGTPDEVVSALSSDALLAHVDEVAIQIHPVDAPHEQTMRAIELFAVSVAPALGWDASVSPVVERGNSCS
ncbi:putative FMN-dependent luciferase-like monooxygenase [Microbacterium sp. A93]|uniref:putative FMN-dependent luciferase-like monooxygenase n=1 Tax=Microbacterium sp. A93 TaxID=3450716 RepID=UPI003F437D94